MYWCTDVLPLTRVQQVLGLRQVGAEVQERDFVAPILCRPNVLLVGPLELLPIDVNYAILTQVLLTWLVAG